MEICWDLNKADRNKESQKYCLCYEVAYTDQMRLIAVANCSRSKWVYIFSVMEVPA